MNTRIRYSKVNDTTFKSMQVLKASTGIEYVAVLEKAAAGVEAYVYKADNPTQGNHVGALSASSLHKAKIKVKKLLKSLGVVFNDEVRKKQNET